jgi:hypothetical protein
MTRPLIAAAMVTLGFAAFSLEAAAQQQYQRPHHRAPAYSQQDQSYLDPGPPPPQVRVPNYVAIGESDFSQPFYNSMSDPGGADFEDFSND